MRSINLPEQSLHSHLSVSVGPARTPGCQRSDKLPASPKTRTDWRSRQPQRPSGAKRTDVHRAAQAELQRRRR